MKFRLLIVIYLSFNHLYADDNLNFYTKKALENNLQLKAERKILKQQNKIKIF